MASRRVVLVALLLFAGLVVLPAARSAAAPGRPAAVRQCGRVSETAGKLLRVRANGVGCVRARTLMRSYLRTRGKNCTANACLKRVKGFTCATNPDGVSGVSDVLVACARNRQWVRALS